MNYFEIPAVNWSTLKFMRESPMMYRYRLSVPMEDTPALALGRATHTLVFEPETFSDGYVIWQGGRRAGKEWDAFCAENCDKTILRDQDAELVTAIAESVRRHPLVQPYLVAGGEFEVPALWRDPETGLECKARLDWLCRRGGILLDLKTCISAEARRFGAAAARFGYHCQLAHYRNAAQLGLNTQIRKVLIVAVEKEPPHDVAVFQVSEDDLYLANVEVTMLLRAVQVCRESNVWPGRYIEEQALQLPAWVSMDDEEEAERFDLVA